MHNAYIGIGSNLNNPLQQVRNAIKALHLLSADGKIICSSVYQSTPLSKIESATENNSDQADYLNTVVRIKTNDSAIQLLDALQQIENDQGRERTAEHWAARTLDLDLLLFDNEIINLPSLQVPHYGIQKRNFVIYPLADIDANLILPDGTSISDLYQSCSSNGIRKID